MGILSTIAKAFGLGGQERSAHGPASRISGAGPILGWRKEPPKIGTLQFLQAYETSPWVRAVAGRVSQSVGETEWRLKRSDTGADVKRNHPLLRALRRPNPTMSGTTLTRVTQLSLDLTGDSFWLLVFNNLGVPVEFWPLPPHWVTELPTPNDPFFRVSWQQWQAKIPEDRICWFSDSAPADPYGRGSGVLQALADEVSTDEYASKHAGQTFFNRATPEVVVMDVNANDPELKIHERNWTSKLGGMFKAMKPYFTNRDLDFWQPQQMNMENLTLVPLRKFERDTQMQCWGIPPEQLGVLEDSNRATIDASEMIYEKRLIRPRRSFLAEELTLKIAWIFDERLQVTFLDTVPEDKEFSKEILKTAPYSFTIDEIRALRGAEPLDDPKEGALRPLMLNQGVSEDLTEITLDEKQDHDFAMDEEAVKPEPDPDPSEDPPEDPPEDPDDDPEDGEEDEE